MKPKFFLDSGAYSAKTKGIDINIDEYIAFIKANIDIIDVYANLDSIGDPVGTLKNQRYMEAQGLRPLPCYHYGEPFEYLEMYAKEYDYLALGGMVPISNAKLYPWLDDVWKNHLCDKDGMPKIKVHGFGMTSVDIMIRYPWFSVDSTSWVMTSRFGGFFMPQLKDGQWNYLATPLKITVSEKSVKGNHFFHQSPGEREIIKNYVESLGFKLGTSRVNEAGEVEVIEQGATNSYEVRDKLNILYFQALEKSLTWPRPFKCNTENQIRTLF